MTRPLLSLVLPVKNEAKSIREVLETAAPHVERGVVVDTGSTDGTQGIVREVGRRLPFALVERPFVGCAELGLPQVIDYAATRNMVLEVDREVEVRNHAAGETVPPAVFQLMLSGDEFLRGGEKLREKLLNVRGDVDLLWIPVVVNGKASASQPRVFRAGGAWRYRKEVHEFPAHEDPSAPQAFVEGAHVEHVVADNEARVENIWEQHVPVLKAMLERDPADAHALFFLAQSYEALLPFMPAHEKLMVSLEAMGLYLRRRALPYATDAERMHVEVQYLDFARGTGVYAPEEIYLRAKALADANPANPDLALLCAETASFTKIVGIEGVYALFCRAAEVARGAGAARGAAVASLDVEWQAHRFAAIAARQIARKIPAKAEEYLPRVREHVSAGLAAGGTWEIFKSVMQEPVVDLSR